MLLAGLQSGTYGLGLRVRVVEHLGFFFFFGLGVRVRVVEDLRFRV